jgi:hypothetical protein
MDSRLTNDERKIVDLLAEAFNAFVKLVVIHPSDNLEFCHAIHVAQNIILSRPEVLAIKEEENVE